MSGDGCIIEDDKSMPKPDSDNWNRRNGGDYRRAHKSLSCDLRSIIVMSRSRLYGTISGVQWLKFCLKANNCRAQVYSNWRRRNGSEYRRLRKSLPSSLPMKGLAGRIRSCRMIEDFQWLTFPCRQRTSAELRSTAIGEGE